jgi:hypothetical protein
LSSVKAERRRARDVQLDGAVLSRAGKTAFIVKRTHDKRTLG